MIAPAEIDICVISECKLTRETSFSRRTDRRGDRTGRKAIKEQREERDREREREREREEGSEEQNGRRRELREGGGQISFRTREGYAYVEQNPVRT